jgi:hypothetical protein
MMQVRAGAAEWGEIVGPLLAFGGAYSNLQALQALESEAARLGIPPANWVCTGDAVAYASHPAEVVGRLRALGVRMIAGNVERQLATGGGDCGCGFGDGSACDLLSARWFAHADAAIDGETRAWLADLPDRAALIHAGRRWAAVHGGARQVNRFIWPTATEAEIAGELDALAADIGRVDGALAGHCGMAFARRIDGAADTRTWLNAGAIGMPPHDGDPRGEFAVIGADGAICLHRLAYDHDAAARDMAAAGLPSAYADALRTGIWASQDILPAALRLPRAAS